MSKNYTNNEVEHIKDEETKIEYLRFKALEKYKDRIDVIVTLRHGGVSDGILNSLNVRAAGTDKIENVLENVSRIGKVINTDLEHICKGSQAHTDNVIYINENNMDEFAYAKLKDYEVDGYITDRGKLATLVTTADCNPIVIYDPVKNVVANVHSGWKGTIKRIYLVALNKLKDEFGTNVEDVIVCVGPAVGQSCFSSEEESFKENFTNIWPDEENYIYYEKENPKRFHTDLKYVITKDFKNEGVKEENIHFADICTCCNAEDFYSFRYKTMHKEEDYGCFATVVKLK